MEKKITVYVVKSTDAEVIYPTQSRANEAVELLAKFNVNATIDKVKKTVTLA